MFRISIRVLFFCAAFLASSLYCWADNPAWLDPSSRAIRYPADSYYVGIWSQDIDGGSTEEATRRAVENARHELVRSINSEIHLHTSGSIETVDSDTGYSETESFSQSTSESVHAMLVNTSSETFLHPDHKLVSAFVYISKRDLHEYNVSQVEKRLTDIRSAFSDVKRLFQSGEKKEAHRQSLSLPALFDGIDPHLQAINSIGIDRDRHSYFTSAFASLRSDISRFISESDREVTVFIKSDESIGTRRVDIISALLKRKISENGCQIVDSPDGADYLLSVSATTRRSSLPATDVIYVFADADIVLTNIARNKHLFQTQISCKGGGLNIDKASRKALGNVGKEIVESLIDKIK